MQQQGRVPPAQEGAGPALPPTQQPHSHSAGQQRAPGVDGPKKPSSPTVTSCMGASALRNAALASIQRCAAARVAAGRVAARALVPPQHAASATRRWMPAGLLGGGAGGLESKPAHLQHVARGVGVAARLVGEVPGVDGGVVPVAAGAAPAGRGRRAGRRRGLAPVSSLLAGGKSATESALPLGAPRPGPPVGDACEGVDPRDHVPHVALVQPQALRVRVEVCRAHVGGGVLALRPPARRGGRGAAAGVPAAAGAPGRGGAGASWRRTAAAAASERRGDGRWGGWRSLLGGQWQWTPAVALGRTLRTP